MNIFFPHIIQRVDNQLKALERLYFSKNLPIHVVVVGCGYSGIELAATISERLQDKGIVEAVNVEKTILPNAPPGNREAALKVSHIFPLVYWNKLTENLHRSGYDVFFEIIHFFWTY